MGHRTCLAMLMCRMCVEGACLDQQLTQSFACAKWMFALNKLALATSNATYIDWAEELAQGAINFHHLSVPDCVVLSACRQLCASAVMHVLMVPCTSQSLGTRHALQSHQKHVGSAVYLLLSKKKDCLYSVPAFAAVRFFSTVSPCDMFV